MRISWATILSFLIFFFDDINIIEFLRNFDDFYNEHSYEKEIRTRKIIKYCSALIDVYLRSLSKYILEEQTKVKEIIIKEWKTKNIEQRIKTMAFLKALI